MVWKGIGPNKLIPKPTHPTIVKKTESSSVPTRTTPSGTTYGGQGQKMEIDRAKAEGRLL
jgi:hypothetical protein